MPNRQLHPVACLLAASLPLLALPAQAADPLTVAIGSILQPQAAAAETPPFVPHASGRRFGGVLDTCFNCHYKSTESEDLPPQFRRRVSDDGWVMLNEVRTWVNHDKHQQAYAVLLNQRSQDMARILGVVENGQSQIHRDVRCLTCHVGMPVEQMNAGPNGLVAEDAAQNPRFNLGVGCESCHGAADGDADAPGWADVHDRKETWRFMSAEQKWSDYGYYDVRSPVSRARMCASCHVGNAESGRVVTHEMYAAGHPPLPGFEVSTFVDQEPQHWRDFGQKSAAIREEFLEKTGTSYDPAHLHETKHLLVGALVNLSEYLRLTAHLAEADATMPVSRPEWPELAQFACYACHHELRVPSWRQERGYAVGSVSSVALIPGRPAPHEWPFTLAQLGVRIAGQNPQQVEERLRRLAQPLNEQPFGSHQSLPPAAHAIADWAYGAAVQIEQQAITPEQGRALLSELAQAASRQPLDYDSARQITWAFNVIYRELGQRGEPLPFNPDGQDIGWFARRDNLDPVERQLASLDSMLLLDLRKGRQTPQPVPGEEEARTLLEVNLELVLAPIDNYKPAEFNQKFAEVAESLEQQRTSAE